MRTIKEILSKNIKASRERLGYSQSKLAELVGVSVPFIGEIEICRKNPSFDNLEKIAKALGLQVYQLFLEKEEKKTVDKQVLLHNFKRDLEKGIETTIEILYERYQKD